MFYCWWVRLPRRHRHFGRWHRHIHRLIGHGHGHVFWAVGGAVGAATAVLVCTAIGPGLWHPPPHFSQPHGGPGLAPEELSAVPAPFIGGPGLSGGAIWRRTRSGSGPGHRQWLGRRRNKPDWKSSRSAWFDRSGSRAGCCGNRPGAGAVIGVDIERSCARDGIAPRRDRAEQRPAMADRGRADIDQMLRPAAPLCRALPSSLSSAFASFRSGVPKPSVNQP